MKASRKDAGPQESAQPVERSSPWLTSTKCEKTDLEMTVTIVTIPNKAKEQQFLPGELNKCRFTLTCACQSPRKSVNTRRNYEVLFSALNKNDHF